MPAISLFGAFAKRGIAFHQCKLSASELYIAALPAFTSKTVSLLDQPRAIDQFINLSAARSAAAAPKP